MHHLLAIVDDDLSVREALPPLLRSFGYEVRSFSSGEEFLASKDLQRIECVLLDVKMHGLSGPDVQEEMIRRGLSIPTVFITAHPKESVCAGVLRAGAVGCLPKPFSEEAIMGAIDRALTAH